ncbi:hypothetical protein CSUI_006298 [Cystoisospora suis]|uniref:Transmembrane protein n=1 Tax=Cystoisospora suis TaxID=483139 RepID=A0A2C6KUY5_9APIC|nr:hypothetical protein CSUI_006298 [Cystoisospora suis]
MNERRQVTNFQRKISLFLLQWARSAIGMCGICRVMRRQLAHVDCLYRFIETSQKRKASCQDVQESRNWADRFSILPLSPQSSLILNVFVRRFSIESRDNWRNRKLKSGDKNCMPSPKSSSNSKERKKKEKERVREKERKKERRKESVRKKEKVGGRNDACSSRKKNSEALHYCGMGRLIQGIVIKEEMSCEEEERKKEGRNFFLFPSVRERDRKKERQKENRSSLITKGETREETMSGRTKEKKRKRKRRNRQRDRERFLSLFLLLLLPLLSFVHGV